MSLSDIFEAPYNYDQDATVSYSYDKTGFCIGYQVGIFHEKQGVFLQEQRGITPRDLNTFLVQRGYRQMIKNETLFDPRWDYRLRAPAWELFRLWLITYYTDEHAKQEQQMEKYANDPSHVIREFYTNAVARKEAYAVILTQLQQETSPDCNTLWQWTAEQIGASHKNRVTGYTYKHICDAFRDYQELMERVHHARKWGE